MRATAVQNLYNGLYNTSTPSKSTSLVPLLLPLLVPALGGDYANKSASDQVRVSLEMELGVRDTYGRLKAARTSPRPVMYTCIAIELNTLDNSSARAAYTLSYEYVDGLGYKQSWTLDQKRASLYSHISPFRVSSTGARESRIRADSVSI